MIFLTSRTPVHRLSALTRATAFAAGAALLAGCAATTQTPAAEGPAAPAATAVPDPTPAPGGDVSHAGPAGLPSPHVHGVAVNPADDRVYLATHDGLFRYGQEGPTRIGPVIDLMGFTVAGPDHFYASGHPGPGVDLPQPVGLIESTDGGQTWVQLSRQGRSDFHALAASAAGVVGFDGSGLLSTGDGRSWQELDPPVAPYALTASLQGDVLLATSETGPIRSVDAGRSWALLEGAPLLQVVDWADGDRVVGVTPEGSVAVSDDAGSTWTRRGTVAGAPQAVGALAATDGSLRVLVVTGTGVLDSADGGVSFTPLDLM